MSIIIVVMPKVEDAKKIRRILVNHGFTDTIFCPTGAGALMEINKYTSGLVVSGYRLSDMYYRELSENLPKYFDILLIGSASAVKSSVHNTLKKLEGIGLLKMSGKKRMLTNLGIQVAQLL